MRLEDEARMDWNPGILVRNPGCILDLAVTNPFYYVPLLFLCKGERERERERERVGANGVNGGSDPGVRSRM
jgi:hypothetical protein